MDKIPLFYKLPQTALRIFSGRNLLGHLLAIALTVAIVTTDTDWSYYQATRSMALQQLARPAIHFGFVIPIWGTAILLLVGLLWQSRRLMTTAWALGQAALLGYLTASFYKAFTGRIPPPFHGGHYKGLTAANVDSGHGFQLGFWRGGIFWGWPSSHTTVAFSMSLCLVALYPKNKIIVGLALLYALYIGWGVSVTIHWLSEYVAGAIFGTVVGLTVGKSFRSQME